MVHAAFYRADAGGLTDILIGIRTWSKYSHVELAFPGRGDLLDSPARGVPCFSSSPRDGGTRFTAIDLSTGKWDLVPLPWLQEDRAIAFAKKENHLPYDWAGVWAFALPFVHESETAWFCSEICAAIVQNQGFALPKSPHRMSPESFYEYVDDKRDWSIATPGIPYPE